MTTANIANPERDRLWATVRTVAVAMAIICAVFAVALHPGLAARYLSSDGDLSAPSRRALYVVEFALAVAAAAGVLVWRRWRVRTPRRERMALGIAMLAGALLISGVAAEAALTGVHRFVRPLGTERHYFFQHDPLLGWKHRPESVATFKKALVRIDADGLRVPEHAPRNVRARVLLLGDSQAFGDGVAAEDTFAAQLERSTPGLRVLNASVIGYGTDQQLLYFERQGVRHSPDVTVVALNAYDLRDNLSTRVRSGYAKPRFALTSDGLTLTNVPVPGDALVDRIQQGLQHRSHLYRLLRSKWRVGGRQTDDEDVTSERRLALQVYPEGKLLEQGLAVTAAVADRFARSARQAGSRLVVLFLPYQLDFVGNAAYAEKSERLVRFMRERAALAGFTFLDGRTCLTVAPPETLFIDAMHLSPAGHERVAALLESALIADKLISRAQ